MNIDSVLKNNRWRSSPALGPAIVIGYGVAVVVAEAILVFSSVTTGLVCYAILVIALLSHTALAQSARYGRALPVLALIPLLRILSLTVPATRVPQVYWPAMVGIPLFIGVALVIRLVGFSRATLGLGARPWLPQLLIALSGLPLGLAAFFILRPKPLWPTPDLGELALGALILLIFAGLLEEIIFRGMLLQVAGESLGRAGVFYSSALFAAMYLGSLSAGYVVFMGLVGLFFGWCVNRTSSIWGVILAHSLLSIGMVLVWPYVWL